MRALFWLLMSATLVAGCRHAPPAASTHYALHASYPLPGPGRWDLLAMDSARGHVFVARGDRVQVMDASGHLVGTVRGTAGVHGIAIVPELQRGYATNGKSNSVTEFDLKTLHRVRDIPVGGVSPDAIAYEPLTHRLFVFNAHSDDASVVDLSAGKEIARIKFRGNPELAESDGHGHVFVNIESQEELASIDTTTLQVDHTWSLLNCAGPTGLALDRRTNRVFSACQNHALVVTDASDGHQVARVPIGDGPDGAVFDATTRTIFVPGGKSGTLTVIREDEPDKYRVTQTVSTEPSARTIALDPASHRLYLPAARFGPQPDDPSQRPPLVEGSFHILVVVW
jgi:DNA-binding beta-propeller fold protein YncE